MTPILVLVGAIVVLLVLNWIVAWRTNKTDMGRGPETWQGWDDGHGGGDGAI